MRWKRQITILMAALSILALVMIAVPVAFGQSTANSVSSLPSLVEVYWQSSKSVVIPGITNLVILDPDIAKVETSYDTIQFFGVERGETIALGYIGDKPVSIRIRVVARPVIFPSPAMLRRQAELAHGLVGSTVQLFNSNGNTTVSLLSNMAWSQLAGNNGRLDVTAQTEDNNYAAGHTFNIRNGSVYYHNPGLDLHALDYSVSLTNNDPIYHMSPYIGSDVIQLRGAAVTLRRGDNQYMFFGGTTIPFFYLTFASTRDIGGFSFLHKQSDKLSLFTTSSYIDTPTDFLGLSGKRENEFMQTGGFTYALDKHWMLQGTGGGGSHGGMGRGEVDYVGKGLSFFAAGSKSSTLFPLNQLFSLFSSNTSVKSGLSLRSGEHFTESLYYQHSITDAFNNIIDPGSSDYLSPVVIYRITRAQDLMFTYTYSHNTGGFANQASTGNRFDTNWRYQLAPQMSNDAELIIGSVQDPLQLNSEDEFTLRDSFSFPVKGGNMLAAFQHTRRNPSLVQKINSELGLLSPALQAVFLADPAAFIANNNVPPEVRALLDAQVPFDTSVFASGQFHLTRKLFVAPNFSFARASSGISQSWTPFVGYNLVYELTPTLRLNSGLSNVWTFNDHTHAAQRTTLFSFGFQKSFSVMPASLLIGHHGGRIIEVRVFRDTNVNGTFNAGERGYQGIRVELENGDAALTDELGRFRFNNVDGGEHMISLSLTQFPAAVRMTTRNEAQVDLIRQRIAVVDFGIVDFARLMGNVFNDQRFQGKRQVDSKGVTDVHLILDDGKRPRTIVAVGGGDFEVDDVPPGDYKLTVDASTLPANYTVLADTFQIHVAPVSTVIQNIPLRAVRSIAGRVFLKAMIDPNAPPADPGKLKIGGMPSGTVRTQRGGQGGKIGHAGGQVTHGVQQGPGGAGQGTEYNLVPLSGIQLRAGFGNVKTDENGNFLLRDLPAGELNVTIVPVKPVPADMKVPSGVVRLPADPIQVQGATIVISNPDLVPYLLDSDHTKTLPINRKDAPEPAAKATPAVPSPAVPPGTAPAAPAAQPAGAEISAPAPQPETGRKMVSRGAPLGTLGISEQRTVGDLTLKTAACLLKHDCDGLQDSIRSAAASGDSH